MGRRFLAALSALCAAMCVAVPAFAFRLTDPLNSAMLAGPVSRLKQYAVVFLGLACITVILIFFFSVTKLGMAGDDPQERKRAIRSIAYSLAAVAILGSLTAVCAFFWGFLGNSGAVSITG